jgi:outer membrane protein assembly factor BamB
MLLYAFTARGKQLWTLPSRIGDSSDVLGSGSIGADGLLYIGGEGLTAIK